MGMLQKLVPFINHACFVILVLLPLVSSYQEHAKTDGSQPDKRDDNLNKLSPHLTSQITLHGFLLSASMGFLMPVGIIAIRMSNREECGRRLKILFYVHAISQTLSVLLITAAAVMSIKHFENSFNNNHQRIGVFLYGVVWLQTLIGFLRPQRGIKRRSVWLSVHWVLGTAVSLLGVINIYTGLLAYHTRASRSIRIWTILFTAEVSFIVFFYLFQDKWGYIQKQGVILGNESVRPNDQEVSPRDNKKESSTEPC